MTSQTEELKLSADVLVIGGGPAGTWAALTAAEKGCSVVLVDKGYCGTSGATAPSGTSILYVRVARTGAARPRSTGRPFGRAPLGASDSRSNL